MIWWAVLITATTYPIHTTLINNPKINSQEWKKIFGTANLDGFFEALIFFLT